LQPGTEPSPWYHHVKKLDNQSASKHFKSRAVSGKPAQYLQQNRVLPAFSNFAARLGGILSPAQDNRLLSGSTPSSTLGESRSDAEFNDLASELFWLQFEHNHAYRAFCAGRGISPGRAIHWTDIPAIPTAAFKEMDLSCLSPAERCVVFHSSGTTSQIPSRHFHDSESLRIYDCSAINWFSTCVLDHVADVSPTWEFLCLTPPPEAAPHSSLVHMFGAVLSRFGNEASAFFGEVNNEGIWTLDCSRLIPVLQRSISSGTSVVLLGSAFTFVHLLDDLAERNLNLRMPPNSIVMETGGYKGRSRTLPKKGLHALIQQRLGIPMANIICEYGMSELSSQSYDSVPCLPEDVRSFRFPPWARSLVVSPETGNPVCIGETGLVRVYDLANVGSVMAIQTEDLAICRATGFELIGRAPGAELRGCSVLSI
jgi:hypothetical protein